MVPDVVVKNKILEYVNQGLIVAKPNVSTIGLAATTDTSGSELNISKGCIWHVYCDRNSQIKHPNSWVETALGYV